MMLCVALAGNIARGLPPTFADPGDAPGVGDLLPRRLACVPVISPLHLRSRNRTFRWQNVASYYHRFGLSP
jgi:hypothetical protein